MGYTSFSDVMESVITDRFQRENFSIFVVVDFVGGNSLVVKCFHRWKERELILRTKEKKILPVDFLVP